MKTYSVDDILAKRPLDDAAMARVAKYKEQMRAEVRAYRLAELRKEQELTQQQLADILNVSQHRVSQIERGGTATTQIDTLRKYIEALGGKLSVNAEFGDHSFRVA